MESSKNGTGYLDSNALNVAGHPDWAHLKDKSPLADSQQAVPPILARTAPLS